MGGQEISVLSLASTIGADNPTERIDAEFFQKEFLRLPQFENRIGDFSVVRSGTTPIDRDDDLQEGVILLKTVDVQNCPLNSEDISSFYKISPEIAQRMSKTRLLPEDILLNIVGATTDVIGRTAFVPMDFPEANITQAMALVRTDHKMVSEVVFSFLAGKFGQAQIRRLARPTGQYNLNIPEVESIKVPNFSKALSSAIKLSIGNSMMLSNMSARFIRGAEVHLLEAFGLANWIPPEPLAYSASASEAFASGRLDAQFFAPRIQQLIDHLSGADTTVGAVAVPRREKFNADRHGDFDYIEIGDLDGTGTTGSSRTAADDAPSRATWFVRPGDIITSTVRPIRRLSAQIAAEQDGYVCSSGFVVLNPTNVKPELLLTYLRLPVICELMDLFASASMYPAISENDILNLPFPAVDKVTEQAVVAAVQEGRTARAQAHALLDASKRAVEIAIEDSEIAALAYLDTMGIA